VIGRLLNVTDVPSLLPDGWIAGIAGSNGRFVARSGGNASFTGQAVSQGWKAILERPGRYESVSLEGSKARL
jgi:hypothetical protein